MSSLALCWLTFLGLGGLLPGLRPGGHCLGVRMFGGFSAFLVVTFLIHAVFGVPLQLLAYLMAGLALPGLALTALRLRSNLLSWTTVLHPAIVMPVVAAAVIAVRGGVSYEPYDWDELNNWLNWMRAIVSSGQIAPAGFDNPIHGYTPGWPIALAYPNLILGTIQESHSAMVPLVIHVAVLALIFDVAVMLLGKRDDARPYIGAWALVLGALLVQATWKLAPTNMLIEQPQTYAILACIFLCLVIRLPDVSLWRSGPHIGLAFAAGYLIKVSMLAFAAPLALLWAMLGFQRLRVEGQGLGPSLAQGAVAAILIAIPIVAVYGVWSLGGSSQSCFTSPSALLKNIFANQSSAEHAVDLLKQFIAAELKVLRSYKLPLTVIAVAGLTFSAIASPRLAAVPIALGLYVLLYFGALYVFYLGCFTGYEAQNLASHDRYARVPLRVIHFCGLVLPFIALAPRLAGPSSSRRAVTATLIGILVMGAVQIWQLNRDFASMATRWDAPPELISVVRAMHVETETVARLTEQRPGLGRDVILVVQGGNGFERVIANYFGRGRFQVAKMWSWGPTEANTWMRRTLPADLTKTLMNASLVWPVKVDDWIVGVLRPLIQDNDCLKRLTEHLLIPDPASGRMTCIGKAAAGKAPASARAEAGR